MHLSDLDWPRCGCGCGEPVPVRKANCTARGFVKGEPCVYVAGHSSRLRRVAVIVGEKSCPKCGAVKALGEFHRNVKRPTGYDVWCKECQSAKSRAWYRAAHPEPKYRRWPDNGTRHRAYAAARRARRRDQFVEHVDARVVYERDDGVCGICGEATGADDFHVDHIVPLSRGGEHSYRNVQVAHPSCNVSKKDQVM